MSKFDNLFKSKPIAVTNTYSRVINNVFKDRDLEDANKKTTYDYHGTEFPDLVETASHVIKIVSKNYANIAATVNELVAVKNNPVLPGWVQYSKSKQSHLFEVTYGSKTKRQIELKQEEAKISNPLYIHRQMITTLECRWAKYKIRYDKIHGEGSYDLEYHTEPIYDFDEQLSEYDYNYEYEKDYNSSNSQEDNHLKKYSVSNKQ